MTQEEFNVVFELQMRKCADILAHKKKEYTGDNLDRLRAFKIAAALQTRYICLLQIPCNHHLSEILSSLPVPPFL